MIALGTILKDNWEWRSQIGHLAIFDLKKRARGAVLGWSWLLVKPLIFIVVWWFALAIGLRARSAMGADGADLYPYFLWLVSGLVPWFFMSDMLGAGTDVFHRYSYLVKKVKFPIAGISAIYALSTLVLNLILTAILLGIYAYEGMPWDVYLLQIPLIMAIMFVFWDAFSILTSLLSGISSDFAHFIKAWQPPLFWLSGILFSLESLSETSFGWVQTLMLFNPVTFFVTAMRDATCHKVWIWEDPAFIGGFIAVFAVTILLTCLVYRRFNEEVADVL